MIRPVVRNQKVSPVAQELLCPPFLSFFYSVECGGLDEKYLSQYLNT